MNFDELLEKNPIGSYSVSDLGFKFTCSLCEREVTTNCKISSEYLFECEKCYKELQKINPAYKHKQKI
jgi:hypothetical protein